MDCRILRHLMLKSDGNLACDDSAGYQINIAQVSKQPGWNFKSVLTSPIMAHIRRSFASGRVPWPEVCENCDLFSPAGEPTDRLDSRITIQVEPTLACGLKCPSCNRTRETRLRDPRAYDLDPGIYANLLRSLVANNISVSELEYIGWGEPLDHPGFAAMTQAARAMCPATSQSVHTNGNVAAAATIADCALDRIVVSCDGATPETYVKYRRGGDFATAMAFMSDVKRLRPDIHLQWKYILFSFNDSVAETNLAQDIANWLAVDSILFVLTNTRGKSTTYTADTMHTLPIRHKNVIASPAAAIQGVMSRGTIITGQSFEGRGGDRLFIDKADWLRSGILEVSGWAAGKGIGDIANLTCEFGQSAPYPVIERHVRPDVWAHFPDLPREAYGFVFRLPGFRGDSAIELTISNRSRTLEAEDFRHRVEVMPQLAHPQTA